MADISALARRYRLEINLGTVAVPVWTLVPGVREFKPGIDGKIEDSSDYESGGWNGNTKPAQEWKLEVKVNHKADSVTGAINAAHAALELASRSFGAASYVAVRYYDRSGNTDAWSGSALVTWGPDGGSHENLDTVTVTLTGDGLLTQIASPIGATPVPIISLMAPATGLAAGGTLIVITGAYFTGATGITFGGTAATQFQVLSSDKIAVVAPAKAAGTYNVVVTTPNGVNANTAANSYIYT